MRRNKGVSMITLIITIIVIIILAAIAFVGMDDATGSAQYARFSSEFGDYATNFTGGAVTKVQESLGLAGKVANKAQIVYCAARGVNLSEFDKVLNGVVTPSGYTSPKFQTDIKDATGATYVLADSNTPCYEIKDDVMKEYKGKSFYGNANGQETHWVTATGKVFTLPGYPRTVDGEERMYISADLYYVPENGEMILASKLTAKEIEKIGDETSGATVGNQKVADAADHASPSGNTSGEDNGNPEVLAKIKVGDFVEYTPDTAVDSSIKWRVWAIDGNDVVIMPTSPVGSLKLGESGNLQKCYDDWKNCVTLINEECKKYGASYAKNIRSLTIEDLEKVGKNLASDKANYIANYYNTYDVRESYTYSVGNYVASYYDESKNVINDKENVTDIILLSGEIKTVKNTYYFSENPGYNTLNYSTTITYGKLLGSTWSWLASPCVDCGSSSVIFRVHIANDSCVNSNYLFGSNGYSYIRSGNYGVRPLVTLSSTVLDGEGDSSYFATWTIKN